MFVVRIKSTDIARYSIFVKHITLRSGDFDLETDESQWWECKYSHIHQHVTDACDVKITLTYCTSTSHILFGLKNMIRGNFNDYILWSFIIQADLVIHQKCNILELFATWLIKGFNYNGFSYISRSSGFVNWWLIPNNFKCMRHN